MTMPIHLGGTDIPKLMRGYAINLVRNRARAHTLREVFHHARIGRTRTRVTRITSVAQWDSKFNVHQPGYINYAEWNNYFSPGSFLDYYATIGLGHGHAVIYLIAHNSDRTQLKRVEAEAGGQFHVLWTDH
jgi:hypothetical protein